MNLRRVLQSGVLALAVSLGGCGGGGGGGGGATSAPATIDGTVTYDYVPNLTGALDYSATVSRPVRGAGVDIVDSQTGAVLGSTATDDNGHYTATVTPRGSMSVRVRAQLARLAPGPAWDVTVRDNTRSDALYALESPTFSVSGSSATRDLHAASGWGGRSYTGDRLAAPFAILDTVYTAMGKVVSVAANASFPPLRVFWSTRNAPSVGLVSQGQIGTTSFIAANDGAEILVLGKEDVDTDEFDPSVIAHEWGHYYQVAFSRDDSPGGSHDVSDLLDQRLAFSEGWGNAWSGIALGKRNYTDSLATAQGEGMNMDLIANPGGLLGWYREASVQSVIWQLNNRFGFAGIQQAMTGTMRTTRTVTTIHAFAAAYAAAAPIASADLSALLVAQSISGATDDPWATNETNRAGLAAGPMYIPIASGIAATGCVTNQYGEDNKLGNIVYFRMTVPSARSYQISVSGPGASDPDFDVFAAGRLSSSLGLGSSETATVNLPAGDIVLAVNDANNSSSKTCFSVQIQ
ncbi:MAG: carboxypeptidase regulatory-like domain-containing protein [Proteobacteria bacterium]|nr:carboxypeptidase regulatory-like domain-containing protein [Pseudomonadota bacterium]